MSPEIVPTEGEGRVLVVDDMATTRAIHRAVLAKKFDVLTAASGNEALVLCDKQMPDLVLLDVEMPGLNGFDTCRELRLHTDVPIIFVTAHDSLEEHLKAYDAGGTDIIVKPVSAEIITRKAMLAIRQHSERQRLQAEKTSLQNMAMNFLSTMGESGVLLEFTRASLACRSHEALAQHFLAAAERFGASCCIALRHEGGETVMSALGEATELERSVLGQLSKMGRIFQFKQRLAINYDRVSVVVNNMPADSEEQAGRIRDNLTVLAETTEALSESVSMRRESSARAEQMQVALGEAVTAVDTIRNRHRRMVLNVRMLLQNLTDDVDATYSWLSTDSALEGEIKGKLRGSVDQILDALLNDARFDEEFERVVQSLRGNRGDDIELF